MTIIDAFCHMTESVVHSVMASCAVSDLLVVCSNLKRARNLPAGICGLRVSLMTAAGDADAVSAGSSAAAPQHSAAAAGSSTAAVATSLGGTPVLEMKVLAERFLSVWAVEHREGVVRCIQSKLKPVMRVGTLCSGSDAVLWAVRGLVQAVGGDHGKVVQAIAWWGP